MEVPDFEPWDMRRANPRQQWAAMDSFVLGPLRGLALRIGPNMAMESY